VGLALTHHLGYVIVGSAPTRHSSRRAVVRGIAWAAPVVAVTAAAPAFAASLQRLTVVDFTSRDISTGNSAKYQLEVTIKNVGTTAVSDYSITFTFDPAFGGVTQGGIELLWDKLVIGNSIKYTRKPNLPSLEIGESQIFTFNVNTGSTASGDYDITATPATTGWTGQTVDDERIDIP